MVIKEALIGVSAKLKEAGIENAMLEAHLIIRHFLKMTPMDMVLEANAQINPKMLEKIDDAVKRRLQHEPVQYILNSQEFMGLDFYVDKNVLIPRQDTETLVECVLNHFMGKGFSALEIGTGSGCISVSLAKFNKNAVIRGIDISEKAVITATKNAKSNGVSDRVCFDTADIFKFNTYGKYDLVVSNPPYIETKVINSLDSVVKDYEPKSALDGGEDGLDFYRCIVPFSANVLNTGGLLAFEIGYNQSEAVSKIMEELFTDVKVIKDLCGNDRVVLGIKK